MATNNPALIVGWLIAFAFIPLFGCQSSSALMQGSFYPGQCRLVMESKKRLEYLCYDGAKGFIDYQPGVGLFSRKGSQRIVFSKSDIGRLAQALPLLEATLKSQEQSILSDGSPLPEEARGYQEKAEHVFVGFEDGEPLVKFDMGSHAVVIQDGSGKGLIVDYMIY